MGPLVRLAGWQRRAATTVPGQAWKRAYELNLANQILALAAQQMLCTAPLLVAFSTISRRTSGRNIGDTLARYLGLSRLAAGDVASLFASTTSLSNSDAVVGLFLAVLFASGVAATQQRGYELIWAQARVGLTAGWRQLAWVPGLCVYLVVVLYAGRAGHRVGTRVHFGRPAGPAVQMGVSLLFFWWSQHLLLCGRVSWRQLFPGSACIAIGMTVLVALSGPVMSGEMVNEVHDYGLVGATFVLSVWLVVMSGVVFGGALIGRVLCERREPSVAGPDAGAGPARTDRAGESTY